MGGSLQYIGRGGQILNIIPVAQIPINNWDLLKLRRFCKAKDTVNKTKWQPGEWEKIFTNPTSENGKRSSPYQTKN